MSSYADPKHPLYNRKIKGTPAYRFRHYFALGIIGIGSLIGFGFK